jgi:hypothetical protein
VINVGTEPGSKKVLKLSIAAQECSPKLSELVESKFVGGRPMLAYSGFTRRPEPSPGVESTQRNKFKKRFETRAPREEKRRPRLSLEKKGPSG